MPTLPRHLDDDARRADLAVISLRDKAESSMSRGPNIDVSSAPSREDAERGTICTPGNGTSPISVAEFSDPLILLIYILLVITVCGLCTTQCIGF